MISNNNGFINDSTGTTNVVVNTTNTVVQWTVPGGTGTYDFQDPGSTTTFNTNNPGSPYTVLNVVIIDPLRAIKFNGTTTSMQGTGPGGNIWFYSPGGIIVGSTASFNVGSLLLTTSAPSDQSANFVNGSISLVGTPTATSAITIESGASIIANNYVAMVAPQINQAGAVRGGGEIAYVAAEEANLTFPTGSNLFTIDIPSGSDAGNGIIHTGTTGGPGAIAGTPNRNIYFVAMPKNTAVTTLLTGTVGYDAASGAAVNSEGIFLVGGGVILNGSPYRDNDFGPLPGNINDIEANLSIITATFLQNVNAFATNITTQAAGGNVTFAKAATLSATLNNTLSVGSSLQISSGGNLALYANGHDDDGNVIGRSVTATIAGNLQVGANTLSAPGLLLSAQGQGADDVGAIATGGIVNLSVVGGSITTGMGGITLNADAHGGFGNSGDGGRGRGGDATLSLAGTINSGGSITVSSNGFGGGSAHALSGDGEGGLANFVAAPGNGVTTPVITAGHVLAQADGIGADAYCDICNDGALGGNGVGGRALLSLSDTNVTTNDIAVSAAGFGGLSWGATYSAVPGKGGDGTGGLASATFTRGTIITSSIGVHADGTGGEGGEAIEGTVGPVTTSGNGGDGGIGVAGMSGAGTGASVTFHGTTLFAGEGIPGIGVSAKGTGGKGGYSADGVGGNGGAATGGDAFYTQDQAAVIQATTALNAEAFGGTGGNNGLLFTHSVGGDATGGTTSFFASGGGSYTGDLGLYADTQEGFGGANTSDPVVGFHGSMQGGSASTAVDGGTAVALDTFTVDTNSNTALESGLQYHGAFSFGGNASLSVSGSATFSVSDTFSIDTSGTDQGGDIGSGDGRAGAVSIQATTGGSISSVDTVISAEGFGGFSTSGGGGNGEGGAILVNADAATIALGHAVLSATGGSGSGVGGGNEGLGSSITITAQNSGVFTASGGLTVDARGSTFDDNQIATGGSIALTANGGQITTGGLTAYAAGNLQGNAGTGTGGSISILATGNPTLGASSNFGNTTLDASGATTAGTISIRNDISNGIRPLGFGSLDATVFGPSTGQAISIVSSASAVTAASANLTANGGLYFSSANNGTFSVTNNLTANSGLLTQIDGTSSLTPTIQANNLLFTSVDFAALGTSTLKAGNNIVITASGPVAAGTLTAGNSILVNSSGDVALRSATVTNAPQLISGALDPNVSTIGINAGYSSGTPIGAGSITIFNGANARGTINLRATRDITFGPAAAIRSDNALTVSAGDDIVIGAGATISGAANPINGTTGFATLNAGDGTGPVEVHSLINAGTITGTAALLTIRADAIQSTGTIGGGAILAYLNTGTQTGNDSGTLTANCTGGNVCIGAIAATGAVNIGAQARTPSVTRISGDVTAASLDVESTGGIFLGGATPSTMVIGGLANFNAGTQSLNDLGTVTLQAGSIAVTAANDIAASATSFQSTGDIALAVGRNIFAADLIAGGRIGPGHVALTGQLDVSGQLSAGVGGIDIAATGRMTLNRVTLGDNSPLLLAAGGDLSVLRALAPGAITLSSGGTISALTIGSDVAISATAANGISFLNIAGASAALTTTGGDITGGALSVAGKAVLRSAGAIRLSDPVATGTGMVPGNLAGLAGVNDSLGNGGDLVVDATGAILITNAVVGGRALLTGGGAVSVNQLRSGGDLTILTPGNIGFTSLAGNAVSLTSTGATISGDALAASYTTNLSSVGLLQVTNLSSADLVTGRGSRITLLGTSPLTLASLTSGGAVLVTAGGLTINGAIQGTTIDLGSQSIAIGSTARIGTAGTTTGVTFRNTGTGRSFIGTTGTGYSLAAAGLARVQADTITLILPQATASSAAQPDVVIGDVTLHGSTGTASGTLANLTSAGSFNVQTTGRVQVAGKLLLTDIAAGNAATITAGQAIDVLTPGGSILLTDTAGAAQGTLTLIAPRVTVASASAISDLASLTTLTTRDARLARNDGAVTEQGYVVGGHLVFRISDVLDIQNSGGTAPADRRGVTAGLAGIDVVATGTATPEIILNGRQAAAAGGFTAGSDLLPLVHFASTLTTVNASSAATVNGCTPTSCLAGPGMGIAFSYLPSMPPPQDLVDLLADAEDTAPTLPDATRPLIANTETSPFSFAPVVDEPVVGIGTEMVGFGTGDSGSPGDLQNGSFSTGQDNGNNAGVPQNGNLSTGPAGGDAGGAPPSGTPGGGTNNGSTSDVPQDGSISTGPANTERGTATPSQR